MDGILVSSNKSAIGRMISLPKGRICPVRSYNRPMAVQIRGSAWIPRRSNRNGIFAGTSGLVPGLVASWHTICWNTQGLLVIFPKLRSGEHTRRAAGLWNSRNTFEVNS